MNLAEAREFFKMDRFARDTGIEIAEVGDNYAKCTLQVEDRHLAAHNNVMGGVIFTLADFTFAVASNNDPATRITVTSNSNISFLSAASGKSLTAECTCVKDGKKLGYFQVLVTDEKGRQIAMLTSTGVHIQP